MASLPYPRRPLNSFHRTHSKFACASPPTDCTDFHRSRRVWHPCHTHAALRIPSTEPTPSLFAQVLPQISQMRTEALLAQGPPTEFTEFTEISGGEYPPTDFTEYTEASGVEEPPTDFTEYTEASGGEEPPTDFTDAHRWLGCVGFCGKIVWWLRGYGRMPYPPNLCISVQSVGEYLAPETSVGSVASVGR